MDHFNNSFFNNSTSTQETVLSSPRVVDSSSNEVENPVNTRDMILPNIFVSIPIHNNMERQQSILQNRIKCEPIKFESSEGSANKNQATVERQQPHNSLVTARPKFKCHKCNSCPFISISEANLKEHEAKCHQIERDGQSFNSKKIHCPGCENIFYGKNTLENHLEFDHQMKKHEIFSLVESVFGESNLHAENSTTQRKSRIYLKSVDTLINPDFQENLLQTLPNIEDTSSLFNDNNQEIDNDLILIDLINTDNDTNKFNDQLMEQDSQSLQQQSKIFIRNVDILKRPDFPQDADQGFNCPQRSVVYNMDSGFLINEGSEQTSPPIAQPLPTSSVSDVVKPRKAKIYIKNVDILKEPIFVSPNVFSNAYDDLNFNIFSPANILRPSNTSTPMLTESENLSLALPPFEDHAPKSKIYIKNVDTIPRNFLHLRTVDELNLMNMNEVQNLIAPVLDQESHPISSENSKNSDESILNNNSSMIPDFIYNNDDISFDSPDVEQIQPSWTNNDYNFDNLETIVNANSPSICGDRKNTDDHADVDLNTPMPPIRNDDTEEEDCMFYAEQENEQMFAEYIHVEDSIGHLNKIQDNQTNGKADEKSNQEVVEIADDNERQQDYESVNRVEGQLANIHGQPPPVEKGRIYVADNLVRDPNSNEVVPPVPTGHVFGVRLANTAKLKKRVANLTPKDIGFKCDLDCAIRFTNIDVLNYHKKCHIPLIQDRMQCPECGNQEFRSWNTLHTHLWRDHQKDMELYNCQFCNFKTPVLSRLLNTHVKIHSNERHFVCEQCFKAFKNSKQLKNHRRLHRLVPNTIPEIEKCGNCGATFSHAKTLREHIQKEHKNADGFRCNVCDKISATKSALKLHLLTHEISTRFKCDVCHYASNDHNTFRRHKLRHNEAKMYSCQFCPYKCVQSNVYQKHILSRHPEHASEVILQCSYCSFKTINRTMFEVHIQRHSAMFVNPPNEENDNNVMNQSNDTATVDLDGDTRNKIKVRSNLVLRDSKKDVDRLKWPVIKSFSPTGFIVIICMSKN